MDLMCEPRWWIAFRQHPTGQGPYLMEQSLFGERAKNTDFWIMTRASLSEFHHSSLFIPSLSSIMDECKRICLTLWKLNLLLQESQIPFLTKGCRRTSRRMYPCHFTAQAIFKSHSPWVSHSVVRFGYSAGNFISVTQIGLNKRVNSLIREWWSPVNTKEYLALEQCP